MIQSVDARRINKAGNSLYTSSAQQDLVLLETALLKGNLLVHIVAELSLRLGDDERIVC